MNLVRWATDEDLPFINELMNREDVYSYIEPVENKPVVLDSLDNVHVGIAPGGIFLGNMHFKDTMDCHIAFAKEFRGEHALQCGLESIEMTFTETMAWECTTRTRKENRGANGIARAFGYRFFQSDATHNYYGFHWRDWVMTGKHNLLEWGCVFKKLAVTENELLAFGMLARCLRGGLRIKAIDAYDRLSRHLRVAPMHILFETGVTYLEVKNTKLDLLELEEQINGVILCQ